MYRNHPEEIKKIAVIGGGPAGCFFSLLFMKKAREKGFSPEICIYNAKKFILGGPPGCNMCAGVIGKNMNILLRQLNVDISPVVQNVIEGYELHMLHGSVYISKDPGNLIFSVFRGGGPDPAEHRGGISFDQLILDEAVASGCRLYEDKVDHLRHTPDRKKIMVGCRGGEEEYDFLVGAAHSVVQ
jgi:flavin-dependent dehydrogenase